MPNLEIEITTTEGILKGTVKKPTLYDSITVSNISGLNIGDSWTLTIHGGKSDFKAISAEFETYDGEDYNEIDLDTVITGSTLQIPGSILNQNGYLYVYGVAMVNGPRREAGSKGNMDGDGSGFLWHSVVNYDMDYSIRVGSGSVASRPKTISRDALRERRSNLLQKQAE